MALSRGRPGVGTILQDTYELLGRIGLGGMGEVYEARHTRLPGRFAVKVLSVATPAGAPEWLRFRREAEIASSLHHPNIVRVVDFHHTDEGAPYMVMEWLPGMDLGRLLEKEGPLPPARVAALVEQIGSALSAAHGMGVVHRDLKPQNVFVVPIPGESREHAKVLDFGISKVKTSLSLNGETRLFGTPQYMSPEQARGDTDAVDGRTDQFALAAMTYEMLTGRLAFDGDSVPAILFRVAQEWPPPLSSLVPGLPPTVERALGKALAKRKEERFASVLQLTTALVAALRGQAVDRESSDEASRLETLRPGEASSTPAAPAPRPSRGGGLGLFALVLVLALGAAWGLRSRRITPAPGTAVAAWSAPPAPERAAITSVPANKGAAAGGRPDAAATSHAPVRPRARRPVGEVVAPAKPSEPSVPRRAFIVDF